VGIWDRLENVISSYVNDFAEQTNSRLKQGRESSRAYSRDPDLDAAYEELNEYLNRHEPYESSRRRSQTESTNHYSWRDANSSADAKLPPQELRGDFECLGVPFGADAETCKAAYKKLVKIHHPDKHAGHEGNFKKATAKSAKINAAFDRIEKWHNQ
jgi:DnaJ-domain-containing protein 1